MSRVIKWPRLCKPTAYQLPEVNRVEIVVLCFYMAGSLCFLIGSSLTLLNKLGL